MPTQVRTSNFPQVSPEDTISLTLSPDTAGSVNIVLEKTPSITWWKALEVYSAQNQLCGRVEMQDATNGPSSMRIQTTDLAGARLVIAKAKLFGVHTPMYEIRHLTQFDGQQLHFLWERDDHKDGPVAGFFRDLGGGINAATDAVAGAVETVVNTCLLYTSPSPRDRQKSRMPSSA